MMNFCYDYNIFCIYPFIIYGQKESNNILADMCNISKIALNILVFPRYLMSFFLFPISIEPFD